MNFQLLTSSLVFLALVAFCPLILLTQTRSLRWLKFYFLGASIVVLFIVSPAPLFNLFSREHWQKLGVIHLNSTDNRISSIAIDGDTIVVASSSESSAGVFYIQPDSTIVKQGRLADATERYSSFGEKVAIDGNTALVSAVKLSNVSNKEHKQNWMVYVFVRNNSVWSQQAILELPGLSSSEDLESIAIDNDTAVISESKASYIFKRKRNETTEEWFYEASLNGYSAVNVKNNIIVARISQKQSLNDSRIAVVYEQTPGTNTWSEQARIGRLPNPDIRFDGAISFDANTIVIGSPGENLPDGKVHIFNRKSSQRWVETKTLNPPFIASWNKLWRYFSLNYQFGNSVDISGNIIVVGTNVEENLFLNGHDSVYIFERQLLFELWLARATFDSEITAIYPAIGQQVAVSGSTIIATSSQGIFVFRR